MRRRPSESYFPGLDLFELEAARACDFLFRLGLYGGFASCLVGDGFLRGSRFANRRSSTLFFGETAAREALVLRVLVL